MAAATSSTVPGHVGGALTTTVSPASSAGSTLLAITETGQLKGRMAATTPWGTHSIRVAPPLTSRVTSASATSGPKAAAMPAMVAVSNTDSMWVLPCSRVSRRARSPASTAATPASAAPTTDAARASVPSAAHAGCDRRAASTARSSCAAGGGRGVDDDLGRPGRVRHRVGPLVAGHDGAVDEEADARRDVDVCGHAHPPGRPTLLRVCSEPMHVPLPFCSLTATQITPVPHSNWPKNGTALSTFILVSCHSPPETLPPWLSTQDPSIPGSSCRSCES